MGVSRYRLMSDPPEPSLGEGEVPHHCRVEPIGCRKTAFRPNRGRRASEVTTGVPCVRYGEDALLWACQGLAK